MSYSDYLRSPEWAKRREAAMERAGHRCQICAYRGRNLDVHHNSYDRIGEERPGDLVVLCALCHRRHHGSLAPPPVPRVDDFDIEPLKRITRTLRARNDAA